MKKKLKQYGFSLAETLIALGVLTVGMLFIAGVFPVGIYLTNLSIERTTASVAADEAFAKVKLYADFGDGTRSLNICQLFDNQMKDFNDRYYTDFGNIINRNDFAYPSLPSVEKDKQYYWSALCRLLTKNLNCQSTDPNREVQVTVFVNKKFGSASKYYNYDFTQLVDFPVPVPIGVTSRPQNNELQFFSVNDRYLVSDGSVIVDNATGKIYRVLQRYTAPADDIILLDKDWTGGGNGIIWVVPPPYQPSTNLDKKVRGQYPCVGVYQKIIRF